MTDHNNAIDDLRAQLVEICDDPDLTNRDALDRIRAVLAAINAAPLDRVQVGPGAGGPSTADRVQWLLS